MSRFNRKKFNNKGLSLVEILVTVVIVALISAPIVDSFLQAIKVNSESRLIQNGTAVAQDTAELFKVFDLNTLVDMYGADVEKGVYTFSDIPVTGADGENFLVSVTLDPSIYKKDAGKVEVNDVNLPVFSGLHGSDSIMIYRQYAAPDETLADLFSELGPTITQKINEPDERKKITKATEVTVDGSYDSSSGKYVYKVEVKITYTYDGDLHKTVTKVLEKDYSADKIQSIYMLCPIFDRYSYDFENNGDYYNSDVINIKYNFDEATGTPKDLYFYIAEQNMSNIGYDTTKRERINPTNLIINGVSYVSYDNMNEDNNLKVYTNIGNTYDMGDNINKDFSLTYGDYNTGTSLYEMEVTVKLKGEEGVVATFNTAK